MESLYSARKKSIREGYRSTAVSRLRKGVKLLYREGAVRVIIFGSVLKHGSFNERSDVDIAVEGIPEGRRLYVEGMLVDIFGGIEFDIVFLEEKDAIRREVLEKIEQEGVLWKP